MVTLKDVKKLSLTINENVHVLAEAAIAIMGGMQGARTARYYGDIDINNTLEDISWYISAHEAEAEGIDIDRWLENSGRQGRPVVYMEYGVYLDDKLVARIVFVYYWILGGTQEVYTQLIIGCDAKRIANVCMNTLNGGRDYQGVWNALHEVYGDQVSTHVTHHGY